MPESIRNVLKRIEANGFEAYIVGGFVRNFLLKKKTNDIDIATNALPKDLINIFGIPKRKIEYGSYHLKLESYNMDITTYRRFEKYEQGHPIEVIYSDNLIEDAKRRDFTINALYMNERESIIDLYQGKEDLKKLKLKMIGNPNIRLKEDPIRILRAIRFSILYNLKIDKTLKTAIQKEKKNLSIISLEKIKKELDAILLANGFSTLKKYGLLNELGIENTKITYVNDISGIWAQLKTTKEYPHEKSQKINQKSITKIIKCGTINLNDLYENGYYLCHVAAEIIHFSLKKLEKMNQILPIKNRSEIALKAEEISEISGFKNKELGLLIEEIEYEIINLKLKNDSDEIKKYIERR